jgi:hypothetical protein
MGEGKMSYKQEIVTVRIGTTITNSRALLVDALQTGKETELLSRERMQFMAWADLGPEWTALANSPTLFIAEFEDDKIIKVYPAPRAK